MSEEAVYEDSSFVTEDGEVVTEDG